MHHHHHHYHLNMPPVKRKREMSDIENSTQKKHESKASLGVCLCVASKHVGSFKKFLSLISFFCLPCHQLSLSERFERRFFFKFYFIIRYVHRRPVVHQVTSKFGFQTKRFMIYRRVAYVSENFWYNILVSCQRWTIEFLFFLGARRRSREGKGGWVYWFQCDVVSWQNRESILLDMQNSNEWVCSSSSLVIYELGRLYQTEPISYLRTPKLSWVQYQSISENFTVQKCQG